MRQESKTLNFHGERKENVTFSSFDKNREIVTFNDLDTMLQKENKVMMNNKSIKLKKMYCRSKNNIAVGKRESSIVVFKSLLSELGFTSQKSKAA